MVQTLSKSVADSFKFCHEREAPQTIYQDTSETEKFCRTFNRLFDCLNTKHLYESSKKRNEDLMAYTDIDDPRFKVN